MNRLIHLLLFLTSLLASCTPSLSSPTTVHSVEPTPTSIPITSIPTIDSPTEESSSINPCGYQWAYNALPELSAQFDQAVKGVIPNSNSHATAFGENCIGNDGQIVQFLTMQTDFYVRVSVESFDDHETFGNWIAEVMQVIDTLPDDLIAGPMPGFVEFLFEKSTSEMFGVQVPIQRYREVAQGKTGKDLFELFYTKP